MLAALALRPLRGGGALAFGPGGNDSEGTPPSDGGEPVLVGTGGGESAPAGAVAASAAATPRAPVTATRPALTPKLLALAVPLFALALLPSLGGHTSVQKPVAILMPRERLCTCSR